MLAVFSGTLGDHQSIMGSSIVLEELVPALLRSRTARTIHIFCAQETPYVPPAMRNHPHICIHRWAAIPTLFRNNSFDAVITSHAFADRTAYVRRHFATSPFAGIFLVHALAHPDTRSQLFRYLPYAHRTLDTFVCPSRSSLKSFELILEGFLSPREDPRRALPQARVIHWGVDSEVFRPMNKQTVRKKLRVPPESFTILYVGRLDPSTKCELLPLLIALKTAVDANPNIPWKLLIVGQENLPGYLDQLYLVSELLGIRPYLDIRTDVPRERIPCYYAASDVFVALSDNTQETFGLTVAEAMASGLPVVASRWDGYAELIQNNKTGYLLDVFFGEIPKHVDAEETFSPTSFNRYRWAQATAVNIPTLAALLVRLATNTPLRQKLGSAGRNRIVSRFTWEKTCRDLSVLWRNPVKRLPKPEPFPLHSSYCREMTEACGGHWIFNRPYLVRVQPSGNAIKRIIAMQARVLGFDPTKLLRAIPCTGPSESTMMEFMSRTSLSEPELLLLLKYGILSLLSADSGTVKPVNR